MPMQLMLFAETTDDSTIAQSDCQTAQTTATANAEIPTADADADVTAADEAAVAEEITELVLPQAERVASLAIVSWPNQRYTREDLTQELVVDVLAALPWAPRQNGRILPAWVSTTLLSAVRERYVTAKREAVAECEAMRRGVQWGGASWDTADGHDPMAALAASQEGRQLLRTVFSHLGHEPAQLLQWRADGASWATIARRLHTSSRTARRRYQAALDRARRYGNAMGGPQAWAVHTHAA